MAIALVAAVAFGVWHWRDRVPWPSLPGTGSPHDAYGRGLERAGLADTLLGRAWQAAAARAVAQPLDAPAAFAEVVSFPPDAPHAVGYRVKLERGRRVRVTVESPGAGGSRLFIDLLEERDNGAPRRVASAESGSLTLEYEVRRSGTYVLRVQPELLGGGRVRITQQIEAALRFPVGEAERAAIGSHFGAARDGGRREHHGIDIFARRGTPVLAAAGGIVSSVRVDGLGGNVVWVRDLARGQSHYYAHLDEQRVTPGARVAAGDTLGTVGNTGNARGTAPHLHFGIYATGEGAIDPFPFVSREVPAAAPVRAPVDALGSWARTVPARTPVRRGSAAGSALVTHLPRGAVLRVIGAAERAHRVRGEHGLEGYVEPRVLLPAGSPWGAFTRAEAVTGAD